MSDFTTNKVPGSKLTSAEWNQLADYDNAVISSGQTPSTGDLNQMSKSLGIYAACSTFYTDSGSANTYNLSPIDNLESPPSYKNGMIVRFRPANANTGASTVSVGGLASKFIKEADGTTDISSGELQTNSDTFLRYDSTNDAFILDKYNQYSDFLNSITITNNNGSGAGVIFQQFTNDNFEIDNQDGGSTLLRTANVTNILYDSSTVVVNDDQADMDFIVRTVNDVDGFRVDTGTGDVSIKSANGNDLLQLWDTGASSITEANPYMEFNYSIPAGGSGRLGYMGYGSAINTTLVIVNEQGDIRFNPANTTDSIVNRGVIEADFGISFDSSTNILDEYEEGTFTPTFDFATTGDLSVAYTIQEGKYTRIGNVVNFFIRLVFTPTFTTSSGRANLGTFPFVVDNYSSFNVTFVTGVNFPDFGTGNTQIVFRSSVNGLSSEMFGVQSASAGATAIEASNFTSGLQYSIGISGTYLI